MHIQYKGTVKCRLDGGIASELYRYYWIDSRRDGGFALFPQVLKVMITKSTKDISREMFLLLAASIILWLIYGILLNNFPIMIANFFGIIQASIILYFKIKNQLKKPALIHAQTKYAPILPIYPASQRNSDSESKLSKDIGERKLMHAE